MIQVADRCSKIEEYFFSKKLEEIAFLQRSGKEVLNLGIGSPDLNPPIEAVEALRKGCLKAGAYGYKGYKGVIGLKEGIASWYQNIYNVEIDPAREIIPVLGSKEAIGFISLAYLNSEDVVLVPDPGYPTYASAAKIAGAKVVTYSLKEENNWLPDLNEWEELMRQNVKMIWINYPNMPTGASATVEQLQLLVDFAVKRSVLLCNDNPYSLILNEHPKSILECRKAKEICLELNSLSKSHNLAGARFGMVVGAQELLEPIFKIASNFGSGMFEPIQEAAMAALQCSPDWYETLNNEYRQRRNIAEEIFGSLNCSFAEATTGMFLWGKLNNDNQTALELSDRLLYEAGVFITPGIIFGENGRNYLRISLCSSQEKLRNALLLVEKFMLKANIERLVI